MIIKYLYCFFLPLPFDVFCDVLGCFCFGNCLVVEATASRFLGTSKWFYELDFFQDIFKGFFTTTTKAILLFLRTILIIMTNFVTVPTYHSRQGWYIMWFMTELFDFQKMNHSLDQEVVDICLNKLGIPLIVYTFQKVQINIKVFEKRIFH